MGAKEALFNRLWDAVAGGDYFEAAILLAAQFLRPRGGRRLQYEFRQMAGQLALTFCGDHQNFYKVYRDALDALRGRGRKGRRLVPSDTTIARNLTEFDAEQFEEVINGIFDCIVAVFLEMARRQNITPRHIGIFDTVKIGWFGKPPSQSAWIVTEKGTQRITVPSTGLTDAGKQATAIPPDSVKGAMWAYEYLVLVLRFPDQGVTLPVHITRIREGQRDHAPQVKAMLDRLDDFPEPMSVVWDRGFSGHDANAVTDDWGRRHPKVLCITPGVKHKAAPRHRARQKVSPEKRRSLTYVAEHALSPPQRHKLHKLLDGRLFYHLDRSIPHYKVAKEHLNLFFEKKVGSELRPDLTMSASDTLFMLPFFTSRAIKVEEAQLLLEYYAQRWAIETNFRDMRQHTLPRNPVQTAHKRDMVFGLSAAVLAVYYLRKAHEVMVGGRHPDRTSSMSDFSRDLWNAMLERYAPVKPA